MRPLWYLEPTIEAAQKQFKNTKWVINGILYHRDIPSWYIDDVNKAFNFMCQRLKVVFRDPNVAVTARGLGRDGLHLNSVGSRQLAEFIMSDIGVETTGLYNYTPSQRREKKGTEPVSEPLEQNTQGTAQMQVQDQNIVSKTLNQTPKNL